VLKPWYSDGRAIRPLNRDAEHRPKIYSTAHRQVKPGESGRQVVGLETKVRVLKEAPDAW
jgi:hypothetical protein